MKPVLNFPPELLLRAQPVKLVFFDVDGVLTDGGLYFTEHGETMKRFHTLDGHGIKLLQRAGITPAVITGRDSPALRLRLKALGVTHARFGTEDKRPAAEALLAELGLDWAQAAAMGDDWPDLPVLRRCALACVPPGAQAHIDRWGGDNRLDAKVARIDPTGFTRVSALGIEEQLVVEASRRHRAAGADAPGGRGGADDPARRCPRSRRRARGLPDAAAGRLQLPRTPALCPLPAPARCRAAKGRSRG